MISYALIGFLDDYISLKNNTNKGLTILNLCLNILLAVLFIVAVLFILGLDLNVLIEYIKSFVEPGNLKAFLEENIAKVIGVILVVVVSTILMSSFVAILKATKARNIEAQKRKRTLDKVVISILILFLRFNCYMFPAIKDLST